MLLMKNGLSNDNPVVVLERSTTTTTLQTYSDVIMVLILREKTNPISNGKFVSGAKSNIESPTFTRDVHDEKSLSKLSAHSKSFAVPYTNAGTSFAADKSINCVIASAGSKEKLVRFRNDSCDPKKIHCLTYPSNMILTSIDRKERWYNSSEIKKMRTATYNEALAARSDALIYLKQFNKLHCMCKEGTSDWTEQQYLAQLVATSRYRGLESLIFVETIRLNQRQNLQEILAAQEDFKDLLTPNELLLELHAQSIKLSTCSSRLAYMLGVGDADVAQQITMTEAIDEPWLNEQMERRYLHRKVESPQANEGCVDSSRYEI